MNRSLDRSSACESAKAIPESVLQKNESHHPWMMAEFLRFALAYAAIIRRCVLLRGPN